MRIFCDQCINRDTLQALINSGFDVLHASTAGLSTATDDEIFKHAQRTKRVLLTFDHDFGNILRFPIRNSYGVVIIYCNRMTKEQISQRTVNTFTTFIKRYPPQHRLIVIDHESMRIWPDTTKNKV